MKEVGVMKKAYSLLAALATLALSAGAGFGWH